MAWVFTSNILSVLKHLDKKTSQNCRGEQFRWFKEQKASSLPEHSYIKDLHILQVYWAPGSTKQRILYQLKTRHTLQRKSTGCTSGMPSDYKGCHTCKLFDEQHKAQEKQTSIKDHSNNCFEHSAEKKKKRTFKQLKLFCLTSTTQNPGQPALTGS